MYLTGGQKHTASTCIFRFAKSCLQVPVGDMQNRVMVKDHYTYD